MCGVKQESQVFDYQDLETEWRKAKKVLDSDKLSIYYYYQIHSFGK